MSWNFVKVVTTATTALDALKEYGLEARIEVHTKTGDNRFKMATKGFEEHK